MNVYDSELVAGLLQNCGYSKTSNINQLRYPKKIDKSLYEKQILSFLAGSINHQMIREKVLIKLLKLEIFDKNLRNLLNYLQKPSLINETTENIISLIKDLKYRDIINKCLDSDIYQLFPYSSPQYDDEQSYEEIVKSSNNLNTRLLNLKKINKSLDSFENNSNQLNWDELKKINLEMGGKNPVIIFDDCSYDKMMDSLLKSSFLNQGQICLAGSRIYVQKTIYKKFKKDFISRVKKLKIGDPFDSKTDQGAIVSIEHLNKISKYVNHAIKEGGQIVVGGDIPTVNGECASGWYFSPTVIEQLSQDSILNQEEIFGPVVTLSEFDQENDVIEMANNTNYGLASIIWTEDIDRAHKLAEVVESGLVWVNCWLERDLRTPFGGIKNSGFGKEGGKYALDFFTEPKNICTKYYD